MNRLGDIQATLRKNLDDNREDSKSIEFIVASFDTDERTSDWIANNFESDIKSGYLKFHKSNALETWHFGRAKNFFQSVMTGKIYASLDGDNYTGKRGGKHIIDIFERYNFNCILHQFQGDWGDGTCGRVSMSAEDYKNIGYDNNFLPRQWDELDAMLSVLRKHPERNYICYKGKSILLKSAPFRRFFNDHQIAPKVVELPPETDPIYASIQTGKAAEGKHDSNYVQDDPKLKLSSIFNHLSSYIKNSHSAQFKIQYVNEIIEVQRKLTQEIEPEVLLKWFLQGVKTPIKMIPPDAKIAVSCIKNEADLLNWYNHYSKLGIDYFFIIDDNSHNPISIALPFDNVFVWRPICGNFRYSKAFWIEVILLNFGVNHWCLTIDSDEYLTLPSILFSQNSSQQSPLECTITNVSDNKEYFCGFLVDLVPSSSSLEKLTSKLNHNQLKLNDFTQFQFRPPMFDIPYLRHNTVTWSYGKHNEWAFRLDVRFRLNGTIDSLRKFPLIKFRKGIHLNQGFHDLIIDGVKRSSSDLSRIDLLPILHYKMHGSLLDSADNTRRPTQSYHQDTEKNLLRLRKKIHTHLKQACISPFTYEVSDYWTIPIPSKKTISLKLYIDSAAIASIPNSYYINRTAPIPVIKSETNIHYSNGVLYARTLEEAAKWIQRYTPYQNLINLNNDEATLSTDKHQKENCVDTIGFMMNEVIGLGGNCQVKHAILREYWLRSYGTDKGFHIENKKIPEFILKTNFFDWVWSRKPCQSISFAISRLFQIEFNSDSTKVITNSSGKEELLHIASGIHFPHDLKCDENGKINPEVLHKELPDIQNKFSFLGQRIHNTLSNAKRILFILYTNESATEIIDLALLIKKTYPNLYFKIMWVSNHDQNNFVSDIIITKKIADMPYPGDLQGWTQALSNVAIEDALGLPLATR